jgi:hypothetical protein
MHAPSFRVSLYNALLYVHGYYRSSMEPSCTTTPLQDYLVYPMKAIER